jgi:DNA polymerase elongation subunit (family B)
MLKNRPHQVDIPEQQWQEMIRNIREGIFRKLKATNHMAAADKEIAAGLYIYAEDLILNDLVISKLLGQDIIKYESLFPHVSAAIQLSNEDKHPSKGDTIKYIYTNSQHKNPLCRVKSIDFTNKRKAGI